MVNLESCYTLQSAVPSFTLLTEIMFHNYKWFLRFVKFIHIFSILIYRTVEGFTYLHVAILSLS